MYVGLTCLGHLIIRGVRYFICLYAWIICRRTL